MITKELTHEASERIHRDFNIPMKNIKKAAAVKKYLDKINKAGNQSDVQKALNDLRRISEGGVSIEDNVDFENWSIIKTVICDFYRREALVNVATRSIKEGIEKKNEEQIREAFHALYSHLFYLEALELYNLVLNFAHENNAMQVIYGLEDWVNGKNRFPVQRPIQEKIFIVKVDILLNRRDLRALLHLLNSFNPHHHAHRIEVSAVFGAINKILASTNDQELIKMAGITVNGDHTGQEETLVVLIIIELLSRYSSNK